MWNTFCWHDISISAKNEAHIEVLEEQIARETCRRKDLEAISGEFVGSSRDRTRSYKVVPQFVS